MGGKRSLSILLTWFPGPAVPEMKGTDVQPDVEADRLTVTKCSGCHEEGHTEGWLEHKPWHPTGQTGG